MLFMVLFRLHGLLFLAFGCNLGSLKILTSGRVSLNTACTCRAWVVCNSLISSIRRFFPSNILKQDMLTSETLLTSSTLVWTVLPRNICCSKITINSFSSVSCILYHIPAIGGYVVYLIWDWYCWCGRTWNWFLHLL